MNVREKNLKKALKAAFPHTIPVLTGYLCLGIAYGILLNKTGHGVMWTVLFCVLVFAGAGQFATIPFLITPASPFEVFVVLTMINARHIFYGISMFGKLKNAGKYKPYIIFSMVDETFSLLYYTHPPEDVDENQFMFAISLLDHIYWIIGSVIGTLLGYVVTFSTQGLDFVLTALFLTIIFSQIEDPKNVWPSIIGIGSGILSLFVFGRDHFMVPAMILIIILLTVFKRKLK